jgi:hypothetical protein
MVVQRKILKSIGNLITTFSRDEQRIRSQQDESTLNFYALCKTHSNMSVSFQYWLTYLYHMFVSHFATTFYYTYLNRPTLPPIFLDFIIEIKFRINPLALELNNLSFRKKKTKIQKAAITLRDTDGEFKEIGTSNCTLHLESGRPSRRIGFSNLLCPHLTSTPLHAIICLSKLFFK